MTIFFKRVLRKIDNLKIDDALFLAVRHFRDVKCLKTLCQKITKMTDFFSFSCNC